ncbi:mechanosensitive ion channel family protein [Oscillatoria laete-virens NRMC-F 0139]|nr:mechanosensitive ion channel family protein [Oscillatoria laete-virens]MDL5055221.1 mechanosensitive ion channel family protein [Oscillatoria laete-virens NRMC-F 0139]
MMISTFLDTINFPEWMTIPVGEIALWRLIGAFVVIFLGLILRRFLEEKVIKWLIHIFSKTPIRYDGLVIEALGKPLSGFVLVGAITIAAHLILDGIAQFAPWREAVNSGYGVALGVIAVWTAYRLTNVVAAMIDDYTSKSDPSLRGQFVPLVRKSLKIFVLIVGTLTILATLNVDVAGLIAGLGIGGLAIALAAQESLSNFFGSVAILADRPFVVGDWIQVGEKIDGNVEALGFRSTKVRTWTDSLLTVPNKLLANEIIINWSRMERRRVRQTIGVTYSTSPEQMEELLTRMRKLLREHPGVHQQFIMVRFTDFDESSLGILVYYFTKSVKWDEHLGVREEINLSFMRMIRDMGLSFAFPSRSLYVESLPEEMSLPSPRPPDASR